MKKISKSKILRAIRESIEHWQDNVKRIVACNVYSRSVCLTGSNNCPLCKFIYKKYYNCSSCPLYIYGYQCAEDGSPYTEFVEAQTKKIALKKAKNMVKVLQMILEHIKICN